MTLPFSSPALSGLWLPHQTPPAGAEPLSALPLTLLVGVTGVGKSTALSALSATGLRVLPDRREVTDAVMIEPLAGHAVTDRQERFALTARYRQTHPGGMAQALGTLRALPEEGERLVFDGLRGLDEVRYAAEAFAAWRFIHLHAPDPLRVRRLLGRGDAFDAVKPEAVSHDLSSELAALRGAAQVFTPAELSKLAALQSQGHAPADILAKTKIVLSERQNYDPAAAHAFLLTLPPERVLDLDTAALAPSEVARRVEHWL
ncbi:AAA family ATPase [Deinococcus detaillensis]|uniref:AAA family ATPase n=1 Tax=Deinococcus detaillensis TaxID=2592048 RepID=A0A553ULJ9_9DEIO|nr:AAA family ATPase [Deinococcus detaillensis]TSA81077.1 AAA family ATPase [Deinococcus detaillensis]